jgi:hypothetical protein
MTGQPATGGVWATVLQPSLDPAAIRYWQITDVIVLDYFAGIGNPGGPGTPNNFANSALGLGNEGLLTLFAQDGNWRQDMLHTYQGSNLGGYYVGLLKEDSVSIDTDQSVQQTPTSQFVRTARNVLTKLDDKVVFTPIESNPIVDYLRFELPLLGNTAAGIPPVPDIGTTNYQVARGNTDQLQMRSIFVLGVDTDQELCAKIFPCCMSDKKGKTPHGRKTPEQLELSFDVLPDAMTGKSMWICRSGVQWSALGGTPVVGTVTPTPVTGLKVNLVFTISGLDVQSATFSATKTTGGTTTPLTLSGTPSIVTSAGVTTVTLVGTGLTASTAYTGAVTVTGDNGAATTVAIPSFTSTAS